MTQGVLWHDSIYDALGSDVAASGGRKKTAVALWPTKKEATAVTNLDNALNPNQEHKLCAEEIMHIMRRAKDQKSYATMAYIARELGFEIKPIEPRDELQSALANFDSKAEEVLRAIQDIKRAKGRAP